MAPGAFPDGYRVTVDGYRVCHQVTCICEVDIYHIPLALISLNSFRDFLTRKPYPQMHFYVHGIMVFFMLFRPLVSWTGCYRRSKQRKPRSSWSPRFGPLNRGTPDGGKCASFTNASVQVLNTQLLRLPQNLSKRHPLLTKMRMGVLRLSGNPTHVPAFRLRPWDSCSHRGRRPPGNNTGCVKKRCFYPLS